QPSVDRAHRRRQLARRGLAAAPRRCARLVGARQRGVLRLERTRAERARPPRGHRTGCPVLRRAARRARLVISLESPQAVVRHLRADERALRTATGAKFVAVARDRQLVIRALAGRPKDAATVERLSPGARDDI